MRSIRLLVTILGGAAFAASWEFALVPRDISCSTPSGIGTCISTSSCAGTSVPGYCPGADNIQCCVRTCKTPLGSGFCDKTSNACMGGAYVAGYCPGADNIECCVATCNTGSANGVCLWTGSSCANSFVANKCPGPNDVQCCPSSVVKSPAPAPATSNPSTPQPTTNPDPAPAPAPSQAIKDSPSSNIASNPSPSKTTSDPSHPETAGNPSPSENATSTPLSDAQSSAGSPNYLGSTGVHENPSSLTTTSKKVTTILKTGGGNVGKGTTDAPLSPGDPGSAASASSKHISTGAVVGISIVGLFGLAVMVVGIVWFVRKKKRDAQGQQIGDAPVMERYFARASQLRHELGGTQRHELGDNPAQLPPAYGQELHSREIYEMRGHKQ